MREAQVTVPLTDELKRELERAAARDCKSPSKWARLVLEDALKRGISFR